jgi:linearmycin/streptolysin S transport system permease protein
MQKLIAIGLKDLLLAFRDRAALLLMLLAPFALTLGLGAVTGRFTPGGGNRGISEIPVVIVNKDGEQLGNVLVELFTSNDLAALVEPTILHDIPTARAQVSNDRVAAAVIIPAGFTQSVFGQQQTVPIEVHTNPGRELTANVVQAIVEEFLSRVYAGSISGQVTTTQLLSSGRVASEDVERVAHEVGIQPGLTASAITVQRVTASIADILEFDLLTVLAPSVALMFLMYTVSHGARSLLVERMAGTLARLLVTPTTPAQILGGKILGIFLTGAAQVGILIAATTLLFGVHWGDPLGVAALVLASAAGATGWGLLLATLVKTPAQAGSMGSALMLIFAILGGGLGFSFPLPAWAQPIAHLTPNRWGIDGFIALGGSGTLARVIPHIVVLVLMGTVLFTVAVLLFRHQGWVSRKI